MLESLHYINVHIHVFNLIHSEINFNSSHNVYVREIERERERERESESDSRKETEINASGLSSVWCLHVQQVCVRERKRE